MRDMIHAAAVSQQLEEGQAALRQRWKRLHGDVATPERPAPSQTALTTRVPPSPDTHSASQSVPPSPHDPGHRVRSRLANTWDKPYATVKPPPSAYQVQQRRLQMMELQRKQAVDRANATLAITDRPSVPQPSVHTGTPSTNTAPAQASYSLAQFQPSNAAMATAAAAPYPPPAPAGKPPQRPGVHFSIPADVGANHQDNDMGLLDTVLEGILEGGTDPPQVSPPPPPQAMTSGMAPRPMHTGTAATRTSPMRTLNTSPPGPMGAGLGGTHPQPRPGRSRGRPGANKNRRATMSAAGFDFAAMAASSSAGEDLGSLLESKFAALLS